MDITMIKKIALAASFMAITTSAFAQGYNYGVQPIQPIQPIPQIAPIPPLQQVQPMPQIQTNIINTPQGQTRCTTSYLGNVATTRCY
jgi:hypothetical protein